MASKKGGGSGGKARDEFSYATRLAIAMRAALLCANPSCRKLTHGPSRDSVDARVNAGCAAHICAAASGGPRHDRTQSVAERMSAANGLWLCRNCGELVDDDETTYPATLLRLWKAAAEADAERNLGKSPAEWQGAPARPIPRVTWADGSQVLRVRIAAPEPPADNRDRRFAAEELAGLAPDDYVEAVRYNEAIDEWEAEMTRAAERARVVDLFEQGRPARIELHNDGRAPLQKLRCVVVFPDDLTVLEEHEVPKRLPFPALPRRPRFGHESRRGAALEVGFPRQDWGSTFRGVTLPSLTLADVRISYGLFLDDDGFVARADSLTHNLSIAFEDAVRIAAPAGPSRFRVAVTVHAHNLPDPWDCELFIDAVAGGADADAVS